MTTATLSVFLFYRSVESCLSFLRGHFFRFRERRVHDMNSIDKFIEVGEMPVVLVYVLLHEILNSSQMCDFSHERDPLVLKRLLVICERLLGFLVSCRGLCKGDFLLLELCCFLSQSIDLFPQGLN